MVSNNRISRPDKGNFQVNTTDKKDSEKKNEKDSRSPYAIGYERSVLVSSIGMEMALPPIFGIWLDHKFGTVILFTILGAVLGMTTALIHLVQIGKK